VPVGIGAAGLGNQMITRRPSARTGGRMAT